MKKVSKKKAISYNKINHSHKPQDNKINHGHKP
jgi:hypothetical protein